MGSSPSTPAARPSRWCSASVSRPRATPPGPPGTRWAVTIPERSAGNVARMAGQENGVRAGQRLVSARSAIALGLLAFAFNVAGLVLVALSGESTGQLIRTMALLPTVAVG